MIESIIVTDPSPKCRTSGTEDIKPLVGNCSETCFSSSEYIVTRAPIARVFNPLPLKAIVRKWLPVRF